MNARVRPWLLVLLVGGLSTLLSACVLRSMFGNVIIVEDIGKEVNEIITTVFSDSTAAVCLDTDYGFFECTYIVDGEILTSTLYLLSEFGITGVLIDPLIVQVPEDTTIITATFDSGEGVMPLRRSIVESFHATPEIRVEAEEGMKFYILELPDEVAEGLPQGDPNLGEEIGYQFSFKRVQPISHPVTPVLIKMMLSGKVKVNGHAYYVPTLPCMTDFGLIPALEIPFSDIPVNLEAAVGDLIRQGSQVTCDHEAYTFFTVPPPPLEVFLPGVMR